MITFENIRYRLLAIDTLAISPGVTSVIGPNGSGKSTLLKLCAGIAEPDRGTVLVNGRPPRETETGYVNEFPDRNILFSTVTDELASPLRFRHTPCRETDRSVRACAETMGITRLLDRNMQDLSGGKRSSSRSQRHASAGRVSSFLMNAIRTLTLTGVHGWMLCSVHRALNMSYGVRSRWKPPQKGITSYILREGRVLHAGMPTAVFPLLADTPFYPLSWRWPV